MIDFPTSGFGERIGQKPLCWFARMQTNGEQNKNVRTAYTYTERQEKQPP